MVSVFICANLLYIFLWWDICSNFSLFFFQIIGLFVFCICLDSSLYKKYILRIFSASPKPVFLFWVSFVFSSVQFSSVNQLCPTLSDPVDCNKSGFLVYHQLLHSNSCPLSWWCHPTISSCHPLLLPPLIFPNIRVFSNESVLCIRWLKYWSFSFSISPSLLLC